jgi:hypothetical protein
MTTLCRSLVLAALIGAGYCAPAQAAPEVGRLALTGVPPFSYGASLDVTGGPLRLRADAAYALGYFGGWSVSLEAPLARLGGATIGPRVGVVQPLGIGGCPLTTNTACTSVLAAGPVGFMAGISARWEARNWWFNLAPALTLTPEAPLPAVPGSGLPPTERPPRIDWLSTLVMGPPVFEVGYRLTPPLDVSLRATVAPLAVGWRF